MSSGEHAIRDMVAADIEAIMPLMIQLGYELNIEDLTARFETIIASTGHKLIVSEQDGMVTGFCHVYARPALEKPHEAILQAMVVDEAARRVGIGKAFIKSAEAWAKEQGMQSISLYSQVEREDAHAFYEELGYERVATSLLLRKWFDG